MKEREGSGAGDLEKHSYIHEALPSDILPQTLKDFRTPNCAMTSCRGRTHFEKAVMKNPETTRLI